MAAAGMAAGVEAVTEPPKQATPRLSALQPTALDLLYPSPPKPTMADEPTPGAGHAAATVAAQAKLRESGTTRGFAEEEEEGGASGGNPPADPSAALRAARKVATRSRHSRSHPGKLHAHRPPRPPPHEPTSPLRRSSPHSPATRHASVPSPGFDAAVDAAASVGVAAPAVWVPPRVVPPPSADDSRYEVLFEGLARVALYSYNDLLVRKDTPGLPELDAACLNGMLRAYLVVDGWTPMAAALDELPPRVVAYGTSPHYHLLRLRPSPREAH